jgi:hypothetical protein
VDTLWAYWPGGSVDRFEGIDANQEIRIVEGAGTYERQPARTGRLASR